MTPEQEKAVAAELHHLKKYITGRQNNDANAGAVYDAMRELVLTPAQRYADDVYYTLGDVCSGFRHSSPDRFTRCFNAEGLLSKIKGEE